MQFTDDNALPVLVNPGVQSTVVGVEYADGSSQQWPARIIATDAQHDLAVLAIDAPPERLRPIRVGLSDVYPLHSYLTCLHTARAQQASAF